MKATVFLIPGLLFLVGCSSKVVTYNDGDLEIRIATGKNWIHDFPLFFGLTKANPPQFALWLTDLDTNYLVTMYATHKIAHEAWIMNTGNRRKEALPVWAYNRGIRYNDGLFLPTREKPLTDGASGATPKTNPEFTYRPNLKTFLLFAEFNHSVDYNDYYKENSEQGTDAYSGGNGGSGQPAIVYAGLIDLESGASQWQLSLIGHSSPDGSIGTIYSDISKLTSALTIVQSIVIRKK
jgi:hypothetical protein